MPIMLDKIINGRTDLVADLLLQGHAPNSADASGTKLISWCAYHGDVTAIRLLLDKGETLETLGRNFGLSGAAFRGHWQLCQFLIESGADANASDEDNGESPLHVALCKANRPASDLVVDVLLAAGADPSATTTPGRYTGSFMRDVRTRGETPLHRAAAFASTSVIERLIDAGAQIDATDCNDDTPLGWASWHLRPPAVLRLLLYGDYQIHPENSSTYDHGSGHLTPQGKPLHTGPSKKGTR